jgi:hypothetical protein
MTSSLRTLLTGLIDYAGLFPPAQLPLEQALANYARYRQQPDAWMLGRFICPANKLNLVSSFHDDLFNSGPPFSILGPTEASWAEYREGLQESLQHLAEFRKRHGHRVVADVLEMKVPRDLVEVSDPKATAKGLRHIGAIIEQVGLPDLRVFFESGFEDGEGPVGTVLDAISIYNRTAPARGGFKLRCGGLVPEAFPTAEQIAFVIRTATMNQVPLKATAGLHHPLPHFDATVGAKMHGFLNVFGAGVLGYTRHLEPSILVGILRDENRGHFVFDETGFHYGVLHATTAEIAEARQEAVISFGSCSFDEPRDDLRVLGWL